MKPRLDLMYKMYRELILVWGEGTASYTLNPFAMGYGLSPEPCRHCLLQKRHTSWERDLVGTPPTATGTAALSSATSGQTTGPSIIISLSLVRASHLSNVPPTLQETPTKLQIPTPLMPSLTSLIGWRGSSRSFKVGSP